MNNDSNTASFRCATMDNAEPISYLINSGLTYVRSQDPTWENVQPLAFRLQVVELWKENIQHVLFSPTDIIWYLPVGDTLFWIHRPIFGMYDMQYNPYLGPSLVALRAR